MLYAIMAWQTSHAQLANQSVLVPPCSAVSWPLSHYQQAAQIRMHPSTNCCQNLAKADSLRNFQVDMWIDVDPLVDISVGIYVRHK